MVNKNLPGATSVPTTSIFTMAAMCQEYLSGRGYQLVDEEITPQLTEEIELMPLRAPITPILSPRKNDFTPRNSFWLALRWKGNLVGTLGARFDDIGENDVRTYLTNLHNRHYPAKEKDLENVASRLGERATSISGGIVYMGDVFFAPEHRGDIAKTQCFCQYAYCLAFARWWERAHWIVALHRRKDSLAGKVAQYGFTTANFPMFQTWLAPPAGRSNNEDLSALSKGDFLQNIRSFIDDPDSLVSPPVRHRSRRGS